MAIEKASNISSYARRKGAAFSRFLQRRREPVISFRHDPHVSILIVTHNSERHLSDLATAIKLQSYSSFEVVIIDNGSDDQTVSEAERLFSDGGFPVTIRQSGCNRGFAGGCNAALEHSRGELIALLNTDATPEKDWLLELVHALRLNPWAAIATPKILFNGYFIRITLYFPEPVRLSMKHLVQALSYPKIFLRSGKQDGLEAIQSNPYGCISLDIPADTKILPLKFLKSCTEDGAFPLEGTSSIQIRLQTEASTTFVSIPTKCWSGQDILELSLPNDSPKFRLVNNAGSTSGFLSGDPKDRGYSNIDCSYYDQPVRLSRFCGCAPLIRREAIIDRHLFIEEFFAYYEDSELGRWLIEKKRGETIYWPRAVVSHYHSSTLGERSPTWTYLTQRSYLLYKQLGLPVYQPKDSEIHHLARRLSSLAQQARSADVACSLVDLLERLDASFLENIYQGRNRPSNLKRKAIGIYNLYWNTRGGGESHALAFAAALRDCYSDADIYLISETDFDIHSLGDYFNIDVTGMSKLVVRKMTTKLTSRFWLFVNSTSHSSLPSRAQYSWYIVSFPHHIITRGWLQTYKFLCNSSFTLQHARTRWGPINATVVYPVLQFDRNVVSSNDSVERNKRLRIIGVGRFTRRGHAKNQHCIISAFDQACHLLGGSSCDWELLLIGSLDTSNHEDCCYYEDLKRQINHGISNDRIRLVTNASRNQLDAALAEALVYVHATGLDAPASKPEMQEHFGIAPVEAALRGCIPFVYAQAGPYEVVNQTGCGDSYRDQDDLAHKLALLMVRPFQELCQQSKETAAATQNWVLKHQAVSFDELLLQSAGQSGHLPRQAS